MDATDFGVKLTAMRRLVVVGAGGHGRELFALAADINDASGGWELAGFVADDEPDGGLLASLGARYFGKVDELETLDCEFVIGVGDCTTRQRIAHRLSRIGDRTASLVHPGAVVGRDLVAGRGVVITAGVVITTNVVLGDHVHLNVRSSVSHDCRFGNFVTVSPAATVCGSVDLGDRVYVGAAACLRQGVTIGADTMIGAGAVVVSDAAAGVTLVGVPARPR
jgi:sugar O-acyltransferase (sialic acid O-acetyltransferase NeuD family)